MLPLGRASVVAVVETNSESRIGCFSISNGDDGFTIIKSITLTNSTSKIVIDDSYTIANDEVGLYSTDPTWSISVLA